MRQWLILTNRLLRVTDLGSESAALGSAGRALLCGLRFPATRGLLASVPQETIRVAQGWCRLELIHPMDFFSAHCHKPFRKHLTRGHLVCAKGTTSAPLLEGSRRTTVGLFIFQTELILSESQVKRGAGRKDLQTGRPAPELSHAAQSCTSRTPENSSRFLFSSQDNILMTALLNQQQFERPEENDHALTLSISNPSSFLKSQLA